MADGRRRVSATLAQPADPGLEPETGSARISSITLRTPNRFLANHRRKRLEYAQIVFIGSLTLAVIVLSSSFLMLMFKQ